MNRRLIPLLGHWACCLKASAFGEKPVNSKMKHLCIQSMLYTKTSPNIAKYIHCHQIREHDSLRCEPGSGWMKAIQWWRCCHKKATASLQQIIRFTHWQSWSPMQCELKSAHSHQVVPSHSFPSLIMAWYGMDVHGSPTILRLVPVLHWWHKRSDHIS